MPEQGGVHRQLSCAQIPRRRRTSTEGVCRHLVRAMRNAGWDLQKGVHEDALKKPRLYPLENLPTPTSITAASACCCRGSNQFLVKVRRRRAVWRSGLVRYVPAEGGTDHAGIVSDRLGPSGKPLVINNWTEGYVERNGPARQRASDAPLPRSKRPQAPLPPLRAQDKAPGGPAPKRVKRPSTAAA